MKKATSRSIAKLAGVSPAAVSLALNGKKGISEQTRQHILAIAEQMNYQPHASKPAGTGLMLAALFRYDIPVLDHLFYTELNQYVVRACDELGCSLVFARAFFQNSEAVLSDVLRSGKIDGMLVYGDVSQSIWAELQALNIPMVVLDSSRKDNSVAAVWVDYEQAAYEATRHLMDLGHRDIAYIGNDKLHHFKIATFSGFQRATTEGALTLSTNRIQFNVSDEESLRRCIDSALAGNTRPTALFCATDYYAIHAIRYLHTLGLQVPGDISIVSIDDISVSRFTIPALTTVHIDREEIAQTGVELLLQAIRKEEVHSRQVPSVRLIQRESTAALR